MMISRINELTFQKKGNAHLYYECLLVLEIMSISVQDIMRQLKNRKVIKK